MKLTTNSGKMALAGLLTIILCSASGSAAWARVPSGACDACHDMHGGAPPALLKAEYGGSQGCITCHSSDTSSTTYILNPGGNPEITVPVVVYTGADEPTDYLAGGNFWWVSEAGGADDGKGHNIFFGEPDNRLSSPPGNINNCALPGSCHVDLHTESTMLYGNRQGCLKCHMMKNSAGYPTGFHHADDSNIVVGSDSPDTDGYYRYLSGGHMAGDGHGVAGIEDPDWEATVSSTDHNEYLGNQVDLSAPTGLGVGGNASGHTTTAYCVGCHGAFHISSDFVDGIVPCPPESEAETCYEWVRHPVGFVLPDMGDYDFYQYTEYNPLVPIGRPDLTDWTGPSGTVTPGVDAINCLSCHRAHGSSHKKHLRWEPTDWAGSCATCHITKTASIPGQYMCAEITDCNACHTSHGNSDRLEPYFGPNDNDRLVWALAEIPTGPPGNYSDVTFHIPGDSPFVRAEEPYDGVCEVCHNNTLYWKNDGSGAPHYGGPGAEEQCTECHEHIQEFLGDAPDDAAHNVHNGGTGAARGPDAMECEDCHLGDPALKVFLDNQDLTNTIMCNGCHSVGGAFDGPAMAKANHADGVYNPDGTLKAGMENWCLACHDIDQACSDYDCTGALAPIIAGDNTNYGFYANGHGLDAGSNYQLMYYQEGSGTGNSGADLNCTDCHDSEADHFDPGELTRLRSGFENDQNNTNCDQCHTLSGAANSLPELYTLSDTKPNPEYEAAAHGGKLCTECHDAHGAVADHYPAMALDDGRALCLSCHNDTPPNPPSAPSEARAAHDEASEIACSTCHNPHLPAHGGGEPNCFTSGCHTVNLMHAAHFVPDPGPNFPPNETGCYYCHADGRDQCADAPLFKNVEDPEGPPQTLAETTICDSALCHPN